MQNRSIESQIKDAIDVLQCMFPGYYCAGSNSIFRNGVTLLNNLKTEIQSQPTTENLSDINSKIHIIVLGTYIYALSHDDNKYNITNSSIISLNELYTLCNANEIFAQHRGEYPDAAHPAISEIILATGKNIMNGTIPLPIVDYHSKFWPYIDYVNNKLNPQQPTLNPPAHIPNAPKRLADPTPTVFSIPSNPTPKKLVVCNYAKQYAEYNESVDGKAVIYTSLFAETRLMFAGKRKLLANTRAWLEGNGTLFANTQALISGDRPIFSNVRASLGFLKDNHLAEIEKKANSKV